MRQVRAAVEGRGAPPPTPPGTSVTAAQRKAGASDVSKRRRAVAMGTKMEIIRRSEKGERRTATGRALGLDRGPVATVRKDEVRKITDYGYRGNMQSDKQCWKQER
ncbi:hypothetical protein Y1Q_0002673 [Alligator mississippiensis]|uniref:Uncharacterized protein n=1 Tax=Alligator mississippiensis TaxID=8496 RepID=A0A151NYR6_ALLMI|nr:hypothetical protein Y1Q_0002673 [Alligator mississippiensis]